MADRELKTYIRGDWIITKRQSDGSYKRLTEEGTFKEKKEAEDRIEWIRSFVGEGKFNIKGKDLYRVQRMHREVPWKTRTMAPLSIEKSFTAPGS